MNESPLSGEAFSPVSLVTFPRVSPVRPLFRTEWTTLRGRSIPGKFDSPALSLCWQPGIDPPRVPVAGVPRDPGRQWPATRDIKPSLGRRRRRRANLDPTLVWCLVFAVWPGSRAIPRHIEILNLSSSGRGVMWLRPVRMRPRRQEGGGAFLSWHSSKTWGTDPMLF